MRLSIVAISFSEGSSDFVAELIVVFFLRNSMKKQLIVVSGFVDPTSRSAGAGRRKGKAERGARWDVICKITPHFGLITRSYFTTLCFFIGL